MSHDIFTKGDLLVTAFIGRNGNASVQIGLQGNKGYEQLNEDEVLELAISLLNRLARKEGFRATD